MNRDQAQHLLDDLLQNFATSRFGKQVVMAVEAPVHAFRWTGVLGAAEANESITASTPFFIASIDKLYNTTIAMMLVERGKLDLERSICSYLPEELTRGLHQYGGRDLTTSITVRHLLTHTSGLPDWFEDYPKGGDCLAETVFKEGDRVLPIVELVDYVRHRLKPHFVPQDLSGKRPRIRYSDTNFILLASIIETVTGEPLRVVHESMLYDPFGLHETYFYGTYQEEKVQVPSMVLRANGEPLRIPLLLQSVKSIYSTVDDMMRFVRLLMAGEIYENPETLSAMTNHWRRFGFPMDRAALRSPNWPIEYAMGMMRFHVPRLFAPCKPIPAVLGHTGSTGCWLFYCPALDVTLAGSVEDAAAGAVPFRLVPQILQRLMRAGC